MRFSRGHFSEVGVEVLARLDAILESVGLSRRLFVDDQLSELLEIGLPPPVVSAIGRVCFRDIAPTLPPIPARMTRADRIAIYAMRYARGEELFHPDDHHPGGKRRTSAPAQQIDPMAALDILERAAASWTPEQVEVLRRSQEKVREMREQRQAKVKALRKRDGSVRKSGSQDGEAPKNTGDLSVNRNVSSAGKRKSK